MRPPAALSVVLLSSLWTIPRPALAEEPTRAPGSTVAAAFAAYRPEAEGSSDAIVLPPNATLGDVMSLRTGRLATGPLFTLAAARLIITASAHLQNADASRRALQCVVQVRPVGGIPRDVSPVSHDTLAPNESRTVTLTTGVSVSPGSYDVALLCGSALANPGGRVRAADLTVTAFAL